MKLGGRCSTCRERDHRVTKCPGYLPTKGGTSQQVASRTAFLDLTKQDQKLAETDLTHWVLPIELGPTSWSGGLPMNLYF